MILSLHSASISLEPSPQGLIYSYRIIRDAGDGWVEWGNCPLRFWPISFLRHWKLSRHTLYTYLDTQHSICLDITNRSFHCIPTISHPLQQFSRIMCPPFFPADSEGLNITAFLLTALSVLLIVITVPFSLCLVIKVVAGKQFFWQGHRSQNS